MGDCERDKELLLLFNAPVYDKPYEEDIDWDTVWDRCEKFPKDTTPTECFYDQEKEKWQGCMKVIGMYSKNCKECSTTKGRADAICTCCAYEYIAMNGKRCC